MGLWTKEASDKAREPLSTKSNPYSKKSKWRECLDWCLMEALPVLYRFRIRKMDREKCKTEFKMHADATNQHT